MTTTNPSLGARRPSRRASACAWLLLSLAAVACNAGPATSATATPTAQLPATTPAPTAQLATATPATPAPSRAALNVPASLIGSYTADVRGTTASTGIWKLFITADDVLIQNPVGGEPFSIDPTAISEAQLAVAPGADCPDQTVITDGLYLISHDGDKLVFTLDHDSCGDRAGTLTSAPFVPSH